MESQYKGSRAVYQCRVEKNADALHEGALHQIHRLVIFRLGLGLRGF